MPCIREHLVFASEHEKSPQIRYCSYFEGSFLLLPLPDLNGGPHD